MATDSDAFWERHLMRQQAHGFVTQASLAVAIDPGRDLSGKGESYLRALRAAYEAGYYRKPMPLAVVFGRKRPAALTVPKGHQWLQCGHAGYLRTDRLDVWLAGRGLDRGDFRELLDNWFRLRTRRPADTITDSTRPDLPPVVPR